MTAKHAHELEAAGEPRWKARLKDGLVLVTDLASGEEVQATAYTVEGSLISFALAGDGGLRHLRSNDPGYDAFRKVIDKSPINGESEKTASKPATEKDIPAAKAS